MDYPTGIPAGIRGRRWSDKIGLGTDLEKCGPTEVPRIEFHVHRYYECSICGLMFHWSQTEPLKHHAQEHLGTEKP